jgi:acyl-CoA thioester hydrolase
MGGTMSRFVTGIEVRFADLDPRGHVNNAAYATYLEQTRARYVDGVVETDLVEIDMVLAHLEIDFERPIELGDAVEVALDVPSLGRTSIHMDYEVIADGEVAATASTVQVIVDAETGRARELPEAMRERLAEFHGIEA